MSGTVAFLAHKDRVDRVGVDALVAMCLEITIDRDGLGPQGLVLVQLVRLDDGRLIRAELHWYEAHGIGKREFKRKRYLD